MADHEDKEQKTEEATPRRRDEARDKGQVAISSELMAGLGLCVGFLMLGLAGAPLVKAASQTVVDAASSLSSLGRIELTTPLSVHIVTESVTSVLGALLLVMVPAILVGGLAGYAQVGFRVAPKALEMDPARIDPIKGMKRLFGLRAVVRTVMSASKVILITTTVAVIAWTHIDGVLRVGTSELGPLMAALGHIAMRCTIGALVVIVALGLVDMLYQRFQHGRDLRMSRKEVKEEQRLTDGDPHVRARIRQLQREMATRRMMADVPDATVVVTNPTHYAVALRYEAGDAAHAAPVVVAKGVDHTAQRIKQVAVENGVILYEDVPLARALHRQVEIGQEVPEDLYSAVATVLGHVYRLRGLTTGAEA